MSEVYKGTNAEEQKPQEENGQYEQYMKDHPETIIAPEDLRECGPEIAELEEMIVSFESAHPLAELLLIIDLTPELDVLFKNDRDMSAEEIESAINNLLPEDARVYEVRTNAKNILITILEKLYILAKETNISPEKHEELKAKYMRLSRAVGIINNNKVDHTR